MARRRRIQIPGLIYHVMSRGNGRMKIFLDDVDYRKFIFALTDVVDDFGVECWNYCIMPNHYHLTIRLTQANLSAAMQQLNTVYAIWWNQRHQRVGHVFQGRFKDQIVQAEGYLTTLCRYIALNPVRARLVNEPSEWKWSSYRATIGLCPLPSFLSIGYLLKAFGTDDQKLFQSAFTKYILCGSLDYEAGAERLRSSERIFGDKEFKASIKRFNLDKRPGQNIEPDALDGDARLSRHRDSL